MDEIFDDKNFASCRGMTSDRPPKKKKVPPCGNPECKVSSFYGMITAGTGFDGDGCFEKPCKVCEEFFQKSEDERKKTEHAVHTKPPFEFDEERLEITAIDAGGLRVKRLDVFGWDEADQKFVGQHAVKSMNNHDQLVKVAKESFNRFQKESLCSANAHDVNADCDKCRIHSPDDHEYCNLIRYTISEVDLGLVTFHNSMNEAIDSIPDGQSPGVRRTDMIMLEHDSPEAQEFLKAKNKNQNPLVLEDDQDQA